MAPERLHQLLKEFLGELSFRSRLAGYQMFLEEPGLQFALETMHDDHPTYTLDVCYQTDSSGAETWVKELCKRLNDADILYLLGYVEEDAKGDEVGEERSFSHPEFDARYQPR